MEETDRAGSQPTEDDRTLRFYSAQAPAYVSRGTGGVSRHLDEFLRRLVPGARVLELGCGGGLDAAAMLAAGFAVDPTDGVPEIAAKAAERLGRPVRVMRFDELEAAGEYDAVWANASLLHVPRPALPGVLKRVWRALKPGGLHFASYKAGGEEGRDRHDRYFNYLSAEEAEDVYRSAGDWKFLSLTEYQGGGYDPGVTGPWIALTLQRPG